MRMVLLAILAVAQGFEGSSLGIGVDVFQRAYEFAAGRVGAPPDLQLVRCNEMLCQWTFGDGGTVIAEHPVESLDVNRIEATLDSRGSADADLQRRYEQACLTIVALVDPGGSPTERKEVALAIASRSGKGTRRIRIEGSDRNVGVYGTYAPVAGPAGSGSAAILRCGATAAAQ